MPIELREVSYVYHKGLPFEARALDRVSLTLSEGECLGIAGRTGSGKSTLLQHLNGLLLPQEGEVLVDGVSLKGASRDQLRSIRQKVGLVFQYPEQQFFAETVFEEVAFAPRNMGLPEGEVRERVLWSLEMVGLDPGDLLDRSPFSLSGGQMRRVAIASVLSMRPKYLVLDEPTSGLDLEGRGRLLEMLLRFKGSGMGLAVVSHDVDFLFEACDRLVLMSGGRVRALGSLGEVVDALASAPAEGFKLPFSTALLMELRGLGARVPLELRPSRAMEAVVRWFEGR